MTYIRETARQRKDAALAKRQYLHISTTGNVLMPGATYNVGRNKAKRAERARAAASRGWVGRG